MPTTTRTSRALSRHPRGAKKAAQSGPVIVTDRGKPSRVLLSIDAYRRLTGATRNLADLLAMPADAADIDFEPPRRGDPRAAPVGDVADTGAAPQDRRHRP